MSTEQSTPQILFTVDTTKDPFDKLTRYAERITTLLRDPWVKTNPDVLGSLDELLGSVYSLIIAKYLDYQDRIGKPKDYGPILTRAQQVSKGHIRVDGKWMAGYYMNSSTYRTASVYHRLLKIINNVPLKDRKVVPELLPPTHQLYKQWTGKAWDNKQLTEVHNECNDLKHTKEGLQSSRGLWCKNAVLAIDELLTLTEAWLPQTKAKRTPAKP